MDNSYNNIVELFSTLEELTGLEVCVYPSEQARMFSDRTVFFLPHTYLSHFGEFCRIVKANRTSRGCGGHDSNMTMAKSAGIGRPFVNVCHAGLAEVIVPVYGLNGVHVATVFIGQVILDEIDMLGFVEILRRVRPLGVDEDKLLEAFSKLPRMSREQLLKIGRLADLALRGLGEELDPGSIEHREMLKHYPQIGTEHMTLGILG